MGDGWRERTVRTIVDAVRKAEGHGPVSSISLSFSFFLSLSLSRESRPPGGRQLSRRRQSAFRGDVACTVERHTASSPIPSALSPLSFFLPLFLLSVSLSHFSACPCPLLVAAVSVSFFIYRARSSSLQHLARDATLRSVSFRSDTRRLGRRRRRAVYTSYALREKEREESAVPRFEAPRSSPCRACRSATRGVVNCARAPERRGQRASSGLSVARSHGDPSPGASLVARGCR